MNPDYETLKLIWWVFIGLLLIGFAITDGFDMGVGALLPFVGQTDEERRVLLNAVGPTWESNQVWLVTAGGALFAAWPQVYATSFSGFYFALILVLFALFLRPVGFDYRSKLSDPAWRSFWDWGLFTGSVIPATVFGIAFGNVLQGVPFYFDSDLRSYYNGTLLELFNPFALLCGTVSLSMMVMHGAVYLQIKSEDPINKRCKTAVLLSAAFLSSVFAVCGLLIALYVKGFRITAIGDTATALSPVGKTVSVASGAWMDNYMSMNYLWLLPASVFGFLAVTVILSRINRPGGAFISSSLALAGIICTAGFSMYPFILPSSQEPSHSLTIWDACSSELTLKALFWATLIFLPVVIAYTSWVYRVMRGKVTVEHIQSNRHSAY